MVHSWTIYFGSVSLSALLAPQPATLEPKLVFLPFFKDCAVVRNNSISAGTMRVGLPEHHASNPMYVVLHPAGWGRCGHGREREIKFDKSNFSGGRDALVE